MRVTMDSPSTKAKEFGAESIRNGINWTWAYGFPDPDKGQEFVQWLAENGYDHRGYYPANPESSNSNLHRDGVRFR